MKKLTKKEKILLGVSVGFGISLVALGINQKKIMGILNSIEKEGIENGNDINEIIDFVKCLEHTVLDLEEDVRGGM